MMLRSFLTSAAMLAAASAAEQRSGNATAEWLCASSAYQPGVPVQTALRMKIDPGWHTYWINPGEGGMPLSFEWKLPEGWKASDPAHPVPKRFFTGELPGFGYEGEVLFPVTLTPPAGATETAEISLKVSWLTCDDSACVPGNAGLTLTLSPGEAADTPDAGAIRQALALVPQPLDGLRLAVRQEDAVLTLELSPPPDAALDPSACEVFPATPSTVDDGKPIQFEKSGSVWTATATRSEYLNGPVRELSLVLAGSGAPSPVLVSWKAE